MERRLLLETKNLTKVFGQTVAVDEVSIEILSGEIHGLVGENGSGKSTISSMINGIYPPTAGEMLLEGEPYSPKSQIDANRRGVSMIVQEMSTIEDLTVAENIFFGSEDLFTRGGVIRKKEMNAKAKEYLEAYGLSRIQPENDITRYSFEERKLIELVKATYFGPKLLVVDETTTALSQDGREELFQVMAQLKSQGTTVIIISHDLQEILGICDRITVLRDGKHVVTIEKTPQTTEDELKTYMIGRELSGHYYREDSGREIAPDPVLTVKDLEVEGCLHQISFDLYRGEILGVGGLTESGMHELGKALFGAIKPTSGSVTLAGRRKPITSISQAIENEIAYASKNRDQEGLMLQASIMDNVCISSIDKLVRFGLIPPRKERAFAEKETLRMKTKMESVDQFVSALSGGNKQKVVLAKWLAHDSDILILDSPTRGIDVNVKASIYELMQQLVSGGKSILMISEELMELIGMCDRLLILKDGAISQELLRTDGLSEEKIIQHMI
jgi:ribose transport system ATP-binding protein